MRREWCSTCRRMVEVADESVEGVAEGNVEHTVSVVALYCGHYREHRLRGRSHRFPAYSERRWSL